MHTDERTLQTHDGPKLLDADACQFILMNNKRNALGAGRRSE